MALSQFSGVTGVRKKRPYREIIEAGSEKLPSMVRAREQRAHEEKLYGLAKERAGLDRSRARQEERAGEKALYEARKQRKKQEKSANIQTGIAGLGVLSNLYSGSKAGGGWGMQPVTSGVKKTGGGGGFKDLWGGVKTVFSGLFG